MLDVVSDMEAPLYCGSQRSNGGGGKKKNVNMSAHTPQPRMEEEREGGEKVTEAFV